jgi:hypothetical protein
MDISFKTNDDLYTPPPVKGPKRRAAMWCLFLLLIVCAAVVLWLRRDQSQLAESSVPSAIPQREPEGMQTAQPIPSQPQASAPAHSPNTVLPQKVESTQHPAVSPNSSEPEVTPQPSSPMEQPADVLPVAVEQPASKLKEKLPAVPPVERPIAVQLQKGTDSLQMLLHLPRDERNQTLRTAASSQAEIDILVEALDDAGGRIGRARVMALREDAASDPIAVLEFIRMPELGALVLLANARLSHTAKLVIVLDGGAKLEYRF